MVLSPNEQFITVILVTDENNNPATGKTISYRLFDESNNLESSGSMSELGSYAIYYKAWTPNAEGYWKFEAYYSGSDFHFYDLKMYQVGKGVEDDNYDLLTHATYGLSALNTDLDAIITTLGTPVTDIASDIADLITRSKGLDEIHDDLATHDSDIKADLGDFSGQTNLTSLLAVLGVPDVAGKPLYTVLVTDRLDHATYGLSALNTDLDAIITHIESGVYGLSAIKEYVDSLETWLGNPSGDTLTTITAKLGDPKGAFGGLIQAASTLTGTPTVNFMDTNLTEATDDHYNGSIIIFTSGNLAGQASIITAYNGTTKEITVNPAFIEAPASGDAFIILSIPLGGIFTGAKGLEQVYDAIDTRLSPQRIGDTITADGTEQVLFVIDNPDRVFKPNQFIIDVTNMQAGDTTIVRVYYRIKEGGNYILHTESTYADDEAPDLKSITLLPNVFGVKATLEQTGGVNRAYDYEVHTDE